MGPLIEIKTVPIEISVKTTQASLEKTRGTVEMEISRSSEGLDIKSRPVRLQLDSFDSIANQVVQPSRSALQANYEATDALSQRGNLLLNAQFNTPAPTVTSPGYTPQAQAAGSGMNEAAEGTMEIRYQMDKLNFDWKIDQGELKFTPADIEFTVEQMPSIKFTYLGGPIYVPRSSDPNYTPVNVKA